MKLMKPSFGFLLIMVLFACSSTNKLQQQEEESNLLYAYNFGVLEHYTPKVQIQTLHGFGYSGITFPIANENDIKELDEYISSANLIEEFKVYSVFFRYNFENSEAFKESWKQVIDKIEGEKIDLWFVFGRNKSNVNEQFIESKLREVVSYATAKGVTVVLYPHSNCYFDHAEQALPIVKKISSPNLKLAVHSCHEMRAGNGDRLHEVVLNVKDYLGAVTIAGADKVVNTSTPRTIDQSTIQPLEDGEFDFESFLRALKKIDYKGPVGFINFKIEKEPSDYLPKSLKVWNEWKTKYLEN